MPCCPYITVKKRTEALAKAVWPSTRFESTSTAPNGKLARQTHNKESEYGGGHRKTDKNKTNNSCRMGGKKNAKKIIIMKGYEMDPNKERNTCHTGGQATWQGQTQTQTQKHQCRMATTCTEQRKWKDNEQEFGKTTAQQQQPEKKN